MTFNLEPRPELGFYATFVPNKTEGVYNWFYYKEGYSKELVNFFLDEFAIAEGARLLDPFCGSGTTLLACKQRGINAIGVDVMPCTLLAAKVKTRDYDIEKLREKAHLLFAEKFQRPSRIIVPPFLKRYFSKYAIEDIVFCRSLINRIEDEAARDFLLLALINAAMKVSFAWKDGGLLKARKHPAPPLRKLYRRVVSRWLKDLKHFETRPCEIIAEKGDARRLDRVEDESIDAVITSPPYLNQIDYTKVYSLENWIAAAETVPALRSFVGLREEGEDSELLQGRNLPPAAVLYFKDMDRFLSELFRVMRKGARAAIILGNAYFPPPYEPVECDTILAELAEARGFSVEKILVLNQRAALKDRTEKVGLLRESAIVLIKG
jgi:DNA modification methylase